jgi:hypothetical protein
VVACFGSGVGARVVATGYGDGGGDAESGYSDFERDYAESGSIGSG